jgi:catechol 2,3-dioxygenase-like lactoylglutathione lyase family enzyme
MRIDRVVLAVPDPARSVAFYADVLGLPTSGHEVLVGWSRLGFVADPAADPATQHLAITVPGDAGLAARDWLATRVPLLGSDGEELLEASPAWDACSVYFLAGDGTVLELIARRRLPGASGGSFGPEHLRGISEVGLPVASMRSARERLAAGPGLGVFAAGSPTFTPVGDDEGLLVLVAPGRTWFPTVGHVAVAGPPRVDLSGTRTRGEMHLGPGTLVTYR